jgi:hypothetical protein
MKLDEQHLVSIYPKISNFVLIGSKNVDKSMQIIMENAKEDSLKSAVMKQIYFGK